MKRDMTLVHGILRKIEGLPAGGSITSSELLSSFSKYNEGHKPGADIVGHHLEMMLGGGLFDIQNKDRQHSESGQELIIKGLSWYGHDVLEQLDMQQSLEHG
jgi:hypothetical protein